MCTAISWRQYFGRTLDLEYSYEETVTITPRNFPLCFHRMPTQRRHYALIGMAYVAQGYPLYYDAANEKGLAMAGLNFPGNAVYHAARADADNIASFALIPWILGQCATVEEARAHLARLHITRLPFSEALPPSPLHWILSDETQSLTIESVADGLHIYENPVGVLTNNPPFPMQLCNLSNYMSLTRNVPENRFAAALDLQPYSRGMGAMGLPGDLSSASRFVRAAFVKENALAAQTDTENISQFFHILGAVEQQAGCVQLADGSFEKTIYTSCCDRRTGMYCYTTYENRQITAILPSQEDLEGERLISHPLLRKEQIRYL